MFSVSTATYAAAPTITSFTPLTGDIGTTIILTGSGFSTTATDNTVFFGTIQAPVVSSTATELVVTVPAGVVYEKITVQVNNLRATSLTYFLTTPTFPCGLTTHSFETKVDFATGTLPFSLTNADIDSDGKTDMAVTNNLDGTVSIYHNTSTINAIDASSFTTSTVTIGAGVNVTTALLEDLDGDLKPDLIVSNSSNSIIALFPNTSSTGSISFGTKIDIPLASGTIAKRFTIADMDADGKPDIVTANSTGQSISLLRNISTTGSFAFEPAYTYAVPSAPEAITTGDLNGDALPEIIVSLAVNGNIIIFENNGSSGGFNNASFFPTNTLDTYGVGPNAVKLADFNKDGLLDIAVANAGTTTTNRSIAVFKNTLPSGVKGVPTPSFALAINYNVADKVTDLAIADFDGDGWPDMAAVIQFKNSIALYLNTLTAPGTIDAATFATPISFATATWPGPLTLGDFDGDGKADLAAVNTAESTVSVLRRIFQAAPSASMYFPGNETAISSCPAQEITIEVALTGKSPWSIQYQLNGSILYETVTGITGTDDNYTYLLKVSPQESTSYKLTRVNDDQQCSNYTIFTPSPIRANITSTPAIKPNTIPNAAAGSAYNQTLTLVPASTPSGWSVSKEFPADLTFSNGVISGTPTSRNTYTFQVTAGFSPCPAVKQYSFLISDNSTTWNGTAWSNGVPENTKDAIIDGKYNTAANGAFSCYHLVVNESDTLFIKGKNTISVAGNAINNGAMYKDCSAGISITGTFAGTAVKTIQPQILPAFLASGLINMAYEQPLQVSIGETPVYTLSNTLPPGLTLTSGVIQGTPTMLGRYDFSIHSTEYNGLCEASGNFTIYVQTADPNLKFPANGITRITGSAPFTYPCSSQSNGAISYTIEPANACAAINVATGEITISCGGPVKQYTITAIQEASFVFKADTASTILTIEKIKPELHFLKTGYVLGSTDGNTIQYQTNATGAVSIFQIDNNHAATVTTSGVVTPIAAGTFNILFKITETATTAPLDTIVTMGVYSTFISPTSTPIDVVLEVGQDTIINILKNAQGVTGAINPTLTDIDTENTGVQYKFYSTSLGNFLIDNSGNVTIKPFYGFIGDAKIGYVLTDENGTISDVYYIHVRIQPPYVIPDLKANEIMTPNNDGINDDLVIAFTDLSRENSLTILDEVGNVIYTVKNYQNNWAGSDNKGNSIEPGVYFYTFNENYSGRFLNGYIQILK